MKEKRKRKDDSSLFAFSFFQFKKTAAAHLLFSSSWVMTFDFLSRKNFRWVGARSLPQSCIRQNPQNPKGDFAQIFGIGAYKFGSAMTEETFTFFQRSLYLNYGRKKIRNDEFSKFEWKWSWCFEWYLESSVWELHQLRFKWRLTPRYLGIHVPAPEFMEQCYRSSWSYGILDFELRKWRLQLVGCMQRKSKGWKLER